MLEEKVKENQLKKKMMTIKMTKKIIVTSWPKINQERLILKRRTSL